MLIFHMDMDAFYASVEQRDFPEYRGKPVIVGGHSRRAVVATCSYEARKFGVHSAQPMAVALKKCPDGIVVTPRMSHYVAVSRQIMAILEDYSPTIEPLSLDEAFLDMSTLAGSPAETARAIQARVFEETQLTCSLGVGPNKFLAKFASDLNKPNGITLVPQGQEAAFIAGFPVRKLWGVGPKTEERLREHGFELIGDIAAADLADLRERLGRNLADHLHELAQGIDHRPVSNDRERKSIGSETTFDVDLRSREAVLAALVPHADEVAADLRKRHLHASGVRVKVRYTDGFQLQTKQTIIEPTDEASVLLAHARRMIDGFDLQRPIRLVGLSAYELGEGQAPRQLGLFDQNQARPNLGKTVDAITRRFGPGAIKRASKLPDA